MSIHAKPKLLLLEDEKNVGITLVEWLSKVGYDMTWSTTLEDARLQVGSRKFDLAILDVGLPDGSGFDLAKVIREQGGNTAILFLTSFGGPADRAKGLNLQAKEYVAKPFHLKELHARIQDALGRTQAPSLGKNTDKQDVLVLGQAKIRLASLEAESNGKVHSLTPIECKILNMLIENSGQTVSRSDLIQSVWNNSDQVPPGRVLDQMMLRLQKIIETNPSAATTLQTVDDQGFRIISISHH